MVWSFFPLNGLLGADAVLDSDSRGRPVLAAQVTELADGIFVAMSLDHAVADGTTFWHLFNTWSEISWRSTGGDDGCEFDLSTPRPALDRWFLETSPVPIPLPFGKLEDIVRRPEYTPVQECLFHFSAESVRKLKAKRRDGWRRHRDDGRHRTVVAAVPARAPVASVVSGPGARAGPGDHVRAPRRLPAARDGGPTRVHGQRRDARRRQVEGRRRGGQGAGVSGVAPEPRRGGVRRGQRAGRARIVAAGPQVFVRDGRRRDDRDRELAAVQRLRQRLRVGPAPVAVRSSAGNKMDGKVTVYEERGGGGSMALEVCLAPKALARLVADEEFMEVVSAAAEA